ncbi:restriction endonuclease subunit S [Bacillus thuringiensis]|uniref:restriction endonuclease subunit S n=1 Tax=Bacillus thuringiensis TaxID=1428 RepID=UPI000BF4B1AB|nr:restriction endonuclease subunit S [Bacillus thuringiensis]PET16739.1 hypothetical protein CN517_21780 [Bacillus thuringiensis]
MSSIQEWSDIKLKYIAEINPSKSEISIIDDTKVTFLPMENILSPGNVDLSLKKSLEDVYSGYTYFKENDLIVAKVTPCFENGNIAIMQGLSNGIGFGTTELHVIRVNEGEYNKKFFYYALQADDFKKEAISNMYGVGGLKRIPPEFVCNYKFKVPSIQVQNKVVEFLDHKTENIQCLIGEKEKLITLLEEKRQSMITEAVTKGLNPNVNVKISGVEWIGEIPEHWNLIKFKRVIDFLTDFEANGSFSDVKSNVRLDSDEAYAWYVRATDLENKRYGLIEGNRNCDQLTYKFLYKTKLYGGELLVAKRGEIGKTYLMPNHNGKATLAPNLYLIRTNKKCIPEYAYYWFQSDFGKGELVLSNKSTTIGALYKDDIKECMFMMMPLKEQKEIVEFLDGKNKEFQALLSDIELQIQRLKEYRQSLIYEAVTGKIDVRDCEVEA